MAFGLRATVRQQPLEVVAQVRAALAAEGLVVLNTTDVAATLEEAFGIDMPPQIALAVCSAPLAAAALQADPSVGLLVPCSIIIRAEADDRTTIEAPILSMIVAITGDRTLEPVVNDATKRLRAAFSRITADDQGT